MITIVDYKAGNLTSVKLAFYEIGQAAEITSDPEKIAKAERLVFPGVGAARSAMQNIEDLGLRGALSGFLNSGNPFLGICLGAQIILESSKENDGTDCLGFLPGTTEIFQSTKDVPLKIPQIGWNQVDFKKHHFLFNDIPSGVEFYFVHSYYPFPANNEDVFATTEYGDTRFTSVLGRDNLIACQFHPEKSGKAGLQMLKNFCGWKL
ncbi:MAG: imidazole glycerol phosphate synthase subunit HisH [Fibrobacteria bacterium]|nr:imidazole glycerol phosphate synthase subunit HisH [Fibrobacteria bacterium]